MPNATTPISGLSGISLDESRRKVLTATGGFPIQRFLTLQIGSSVIGDARIEGSNLVIRLPADIQPDFQGQISVQFESTKPCGCLESDACSHDHSGCGTPCGAPNCDANVVAVTAPRMDTGMSDDCDLHGVCGEGVTECTGTFAVQCLTNPSGEAVAENCDGTDDETCIIGECPAQPTA